MLLIPCCVIGESVDGVSGLEVVVAYDVVVWMLKLVAEAEQEAAKGFAEPNAHDGKTVTLEERTGSVCGRN